MSEPEIIEAETVENLPAVREAAVVSYGKAAAIAELNDIREFVAKQLVDEVDFGVIPGTDKPTLYLAGAQKINMYFNCRPEYTVEKTELGNGHVEFNVATTLYSRTSGEPVGAGVGSCSTMESKYRWRKADGESTGKPVPKAYWDLRKEDPKEAQKLLGGFGFTKVKTDEGWMIATKGEGRVENPDIYDLRNTVLKMAKKRSLVDASVGLGCLSQFFTQDLEDRDDDHEPPTPKQQRKQDAGSHPAQAPTQPTQPAPKPTPTVAPASEGEGDFVAEGVVTDVKPGTGKNILVSVGGVRYSTFSGTIGKHAEVALAEKCNVRLTWKPSPDGKWKNIVKLERA